MNQKDFSFCCIGLWNPWSVHWLILFAHTMWNMQRTSFCQCLSYCPPSCSFSSSSLIFFFLMKLKSSKVLFRFAPLPSLAIISSKPWALTRATSNCTDWCFCKCGQLRQHLWHTHFIVLYRQNNCFIASVPIWLPTNY